MEVLNHGKNYTTSKCENCECTFGYNGREVMQYTSVETIDGTKYQIEKAFISCPECGASLIIRNEIWEKEKEEAGE